MAQPSSHTHRPWWVATAFPGALERQTLIPEAGKAKGMDEDERHHIPSCSNNFQ